MQHAHDAGGAFVGRLRQTQALDDFAVIGRAGDVHRTAVRHLGKECPERDHHGGVVGLCDLDDEVAERPPLELGLDALQEDHVAAAVREAAGGELVERPVDHPDTVFATDLWTGRREVEELLGIDVGERVGVPSIAEPPDGRRRGVACVVPPLECSDDDWPIERGAVCPSEVRHGPEAIGVRRGCRPCPGSGGGGLR